MKKLADVFDNLPSGKYLFGYKWDAVWEKEKIILHLVNGKHEKSKLAGIIDPEWKLITISSSEFVQVEDNPVAWLKDNGFMKSSLSEKKVKIVKIEKNYRSRPEITDLANRFMTHAEESMGTVISPFRPRGGQVVFNTYRNAFEEAQSISMDIRNKIRLGASPSDFAVICRVNRMMEDFQVAFTKMSIPFKVIGGMSLYEYKISQDLLAYLQYPYGLVKGVDDRDAFFRIMNTPARGLGDQFMEKVMAASVTDKRPPHEVAASFGHKGAIALSSLISSITSLIPKKRPEDILRSVISETGYIQKMGRDNDKYRKFLTEKASSLCLSASQFKRTSKFLHHVEEVMLSGGEEDNDESDEKDKVIIITGHRCVSPDTLVETPSGLISIKDIPRSGLIATPSGASKYQGKFHRKKTKMLEVVTRSGYSLRMTPEHGMTSWNKKLGERRVEAAELKKGDWLRLKLGCTIDVDKLCKLHNEKPEHENEDVYDTPPLLNEDVAEFLGLMVADGTVYLGGFRLKKHYESVVRRFMQLVRRIFKVEPKYLPRKYDDSCGAEVHSSFLSRWLLGIVGLAPNNKLIPSCILRSPLHVQAKFLRGLFEDGTVNTTGNHVDHVHFDSIVASIASTVQIMLLRFGIISSCRRRKLINTVYIFGQNAKRFRNKIGFVCREKNQKLKIGTYSPETMYSIPIMKEDKEFLKPSLSKFERQNANWRGYWSRFVVDRLLDKVNYKPLSDRIKNWHYEPIKSIKVIEDESYCIEVPNGGKFLQNGFDGWNSKGLEFTNVYIPQMTSVRFPHIRAVESGLIEEEKRLAYVAITRAKETLKISTTSDSEVSEFVGYMGLV